MGPRKKIKPNEAEPDSGVSKEQGGIQANEASVTDESAKQTGTVTHNLNDNGNDKATGNSPGTSQSATSWYSGTWPRANKSNPVTQVAKESISAAGNAAGRVASEVAASARGSSSRPPSIPLPLKGPASYLSRGSANSSRSLPLAATPTKVNITSDANETQNGTAEEGLKRQNNSTTSRDSNSQAVENGVTKQEKLASSVDESLMPNPNVSSKLDSQEPSKEGRPASETSHWLGWFTRVNNTETLNSSRPQNIIETKSPESVPPQIPRRNSEPSQSSAPPQQSETTRPWLGIWGPTSKPTTASSATTKASVADSANESKQVPERNADITSNEPTQNDRQNEWPKSYGWAFWSKDDSRDPAGKKRRPSNVGELALAGSPSQSKPENAVIDESKGIPDRVSKRSRPQSMQEPEDTLKAAAPKTASKQEAGGVIITDPPKSAGGTKERVRAQVKNLVLPSFKSTYRSASRPGLIQQLSRLFQFGSFPEPRHVEISSPRKVNKALVIGVHGYFPTPLIRSVLGQPTGTSIRFANSAASAIQKRCQEQGYSCEVEKVALEGEGRIGERLDLLWKLLLNWIDKIRKADLVMIACHSQGVPVAIMLVAKLIAFGCVNSARIGVCAMAGVNMGPFADYKSRWIGGSAGELFEFCLSDSQVSKDYEAALNVALRFGVRILFVGSIDDQLVSLESSTFGALSHPYVYRAVFVDGRVHAPDFLTHLVGFALKLRNLGISDHGLIRELSSPLAGSLYGGEGHSRIYDDEAVYDLAVEYALDTSSVGNFSLQMNRVSSSGGPNPYILPFAMRGLLEEDYVKTELYEEITELIRQFDDWKPQKTVLKDVKFRLEGVRSKL